MNNPRIQPDKQCSQKGVVLYVAIIVMVLVLAIGLGISTFLTLQLKIFRGVGNSLQAFYAADSGIDMLQAVQDCVDDLPNASQKNARRNCLRGVVDKPGAGDLCLNGSDDLDLASERVACLVEAIAHHEDTTSGGRKNTLEDDPAGPHYQICSVQGDCSLGTIIAGGTGSCPAGNDYCAQSTSDWRQAVRRVEFGDDFE